MKRTNFMKLMGIGAGAIALSPAWISCRRSGDDEIITSDRAFTRPLALPEEISDSGFDLVAEPAEAQMAGEAMSDIYTLNNSLPSPTIRVKRGESLAINFQNNIDQESIIHWHGLIVPPDMDGHPKDVIKPGETYDYRFEVNQRAATYWYHPHPHRYTGPQVYRGMAGFFIVEDDEERALNLPSGPYELPLLIQEKRINNQDQAVYSLNMMDRMFGFFGNRLFVNGVHAPYHEVATRFYRLRAINGSNARVLEFALSDGSPFYLIGNDGGLLDRPYKVTSVVQGPGERTDLLVDFSRYEQNDTIYLEAYPRNEPGGMMDGMMGGRMNNPQGGMRGNREGMMNRSEDQSLQDNGSAILEFRIAKEAQDSFQVPDQLTPLSLPEQSDAVRTRPINLTMEMMQGPSINGRFFEMLRVDEPVQQGDLEIWEFTNNSPMHHPMHIHATQFRVLDRNGDLLPTDRGWKDTVLVNPWETVRVLTRFQAPEGLYVFHCHNLEHEDNGMMANLEIR